MPPNRIRPSRLLALPLELREEIYQNIFSCPDKDVQVLRTCRQIFSEAQPFLFKGPLTFASQYELYEWLETVGPQHLSHVVDVRMCLADVDLSSVLKGNLQQPGAFPTYMDLYKHELDNLSVALQKLPNVVNLTIDKPKPTRSRLFQDLYSRFLHIVGDQWPNLRRLTLNDNQVPLAFIQSFPNLRHLCCIGHSSGGDSDAASIFSSMPHLAEVELVLWPWMRTSSDRRNSMADLVSNTQALTSLTLHETQNRREMSPAFSIRDIMEALHQVHLDTLQVLRITLNSVPDPTTLEALFGFLAGSSVKHLELVWPEQSSNFVESLPCSLEVLDVAVFHQQELQNLKYRLQARRADLPVLHKLYIRHYPAPVVNTSQTVRPTPRACPKSRLTGTRALDAI